VNLAGTFFGTGCFLAALLISGTFNIYSVSSTLFVIALIPAFFAMMFSGTSLPADPGFEERTFRRAWNEFRSPLAVLFSLLLFLQFANEWSVAGWLTIFLIQRLGMSPAASLLILALYWLALLAGRILAQAVLPKVRHGRLLMGSVVAAMFGCTILFLTDNAFGACLGTLLVGVGFAPVYPLVVEKIGIRFPSYHPGLFNGIFSFALTGGLLAPWLLGYLADAFGIGVVIFFPLLGSFAVFVLLLMIWIGAKVSGALSQPQNSSI
ncbi:MAG: MFS transporter, partial [Bryobacteraceae bacterium]